ncbi:hypothetical protein GOP47_0022707 [Adiantum capillus-veneris]|uniref:DUF7903 domain-containing protein n=1 Tax=Adiantum capillus-veneris TaxID=13818 RepID=A0A9D4Z4J0_ADICA|nr:hypothetical protein GOP47_0022707 [Adiantum capillus-veneris]
MSYIPPHLRDNKPKPTPAISEQTTEMPYIPPHFRLSDQGKPATSSTPLSPPSSSTQHPQFSFRSSSDIIYKFIVLLHMSCQHVKFATFDRETFAHLQCLQLYTLTPDLDNPGQLNSTEVIGHIPRNPVNVWKEDLKEVLDKFGRFACAECRNRIVPTFFLQFGRNLFHNHRFQKSQQSCRVPWVSSYTPENLERNFETRRLSKTFDPNLSMEEFVFLRKFAHKNALHTHWGEQIRVQVEDVMKPGSDLWCICSISEHNEQSVNPGMRDDILEIKGSAKSVLELKEVMLLPVRHMIGDVACVGKIADIRLAFLTHEYPELTEMELSDLKSLLNKASIDSRGVHWPSDSDRDSSSGRFKVVGKTHSIFSVVIGGGMKWHLIDFKSAYQVYVEPIICEEFCEGKEDWNTEQAILSMEELLLRVWADCIA